MTVWCIPTAENQTRLLIGGIYDFGWLTPFMTMTNGFNRNIALEDRAVVESSFPVCVPRPSEEKSVATDKPTLRFRAWYYREIVDRERKEVA
jgi:hypothetical protein